ncbi:hypothetical protein V5O48_007073 [Marasmius crinis-equi]|uniref:F-box domain-containing protein n=1 Tax=Marasmius crinis-equi TaxID=585013 RepID=A0ABR3FHP2_9AGAR
MPSVHLPPEIWLRIAEFLPKHDAVQLCNTSSRFLSTIRPVVYRGLSLSQARDLDTASHYIDTTLSLLERDAELAQAVHELSLLACPAPPSGQKPVGLSSLISVNAMRNMTGLRRLEIAHSVFHTIETAQVSAFCGAVRNMQALEELVIQNPNVWFDDPGIGISATEYAKFQGLKKIEWTSSTNSDVLLGLQCLLSASRETLESLSLDILRLDSKIQNAIFTIRFPCLESLTIRQSGGLMRDVFVDFLFTHDTLTHLDLGLRTRAFLFEDRLGGNAVHLHSETLPRLRSFCGSVLSLYTMAKAGLHCIDTALEKVDVSPFHRWGIEDTADQLAEMLAPRRFERVEQFRIWEVEEDDQEAIVSAVRALFPRGVIEARREPPPEVIVEARIEVQRE